MRLWGHRLRIGFGLRQKIVFILVGLTMGVTLLLGILSYMTILRISAGLHRSFALEIPLSRVLVTLKEEMTTRRDYLETFLLFQSAEELGPIVSRYGKLSGRIAQHLQDPEAFLRPAGDESDASPPTQWLRRAAPSLPPLAYTAQIRAILERAQQVNLDFDARARQLMKNHLVSISLQHEVERVHAGIRQFFGSELRQIVPKTAEEQIELSQVMLLRGLESIAELSDPCCEADIDQAIGQVTDRIRAGHLSPQGRTLILEYLPVYREYLIFLMYLSHDLLQRRSTHDALFRAVVRTGNDLVALATQADEIARDAVLASFADSQRVQRHSIGLIVGVWVGSLALSLLVSLVVIRRMTRPLGELSGAARRMAEGIYEGEVRAEGHDEIALLARTFTQMGRRIKEQIDALKRADSLLIAQERLAAVGQLATGIAHEIRNPLSAIKMNAQILSRKAAPSEADREYWDILIKEINRLDRIVNDTLDYSQPAGLSRTWCDLRRLIEDSKGIVQQGAGPVRFLEEHAGKLPEIHADEARIKQVLLNLLINACQAMGGERRVGIFTQAVRRDGREFASVTIADAGEGITAEHLPRIFDPFFSTKAKGIGLGLAISKRIVEEHGGRIEVGSRVAAVNSVSEGEWVTFFRILLPLEGSATP